MDTTTIMEKVEQYYQEHGCTGPSYLPIDELYGELPDPNMMYNDEPVLHFAASYSDYWGVRALLKNGADANASCREGRTALEAIVYGIGSDVDKPPLAVYNTAIALLSAGINTDSRRFLKGNTALHMAAAKGVWELIDAMYAHGSDMTVVTNEGDTALHIACQAALQASRGYWNYKKHHYDRLAPRAWESAPGEDKDVARIEKTHQRFKDQLVKHYDTIQCLMMVGFDPLCENGAGLTPAAIIGNCGDAVLVRYVVERNYETPGPYFLDGPGEQIFGDRFSRPAIAAAQGEDGNG